MIVLWKKVNKLWFARGTGDKKDGGFYYYIKGVRANFADKA